jgi:hypothetical protein
MKTKERRRESTKGRIANTPYNCEHIPGRGFESRYNKSVGHCVRQGLDMTTFSQAFGSVPLYLGVLMKKLLYIVFSLLTPPSPCVMFAGLRSEEGRRQ